MSYSDSDIPDTNTDNLPFNTKKYEPWKIPVSLPWKYPIANITQPQAIAACKSMWDWYHLITDNEWMTIARNIESVGSNWSGWSVWNWILYNWVSGDTTLWCNYTWWNTESRYLGTKTWNWLDSNCNSRRSHLLSNWQKIWDLSWNVWEYTNWTNDINSTYWEVLTWNACWDFNYYSWSGNDWQPQCNFQNWYTKESYWPLWNYNANNWVGRIRSVNANNMVFIRGGASNDFDNAGIFHLYLPWDISSYMSSIGFRCAK